MSINIIGVTGPSGAGKSMLGAYLSKTGVPVIDADKVYHSMLVAGTDCTLALSKEFGSEILDDNGAPDRQKLATIVFSSSEKLKKLNEIVLGLVLVEIRRIIKSFENEGHKNVLVDAPTLIESGFSDECDIVISVLAPKDARLERICARDGIAPERARQRIDAQPSDEFYIESSDHILINDCPSDEFELRINKLFDKILKTAHDFGDHQ